MPKQIGFATAKHGQGCTTVACATAVLASREYHTLVVDWDSDCAAAFGVSPAALADDLPTDIHSRLQLVSLGWYMENSDLLDLYDVIIHDYGTFEDHFVPSDFDFPFVIVTRLCYMALRRLAAGIHTDGNVDQIVIVKEMGRALSEKDVVRIFDHPVAVTELYDDAAVRRALDAGLLASRLPSSLSPLRAVVS